MQLPRVNTVEGAYDYFMAGLLLLSLVLGVYVVGFVMGVFPDPAAFF